MRGLWRRIGRNWRLHWSRSSSGYPTYDILFVPGRKPSSQCAKGSHGLQCASLVCTCSCHFELRPFRTGEQA